MNQDDIQITLPTRGKCNNLACANSITIETCFSTKPTFIFIIVLGEEHVLGQCLKCGSEVVSVGEAFFIQEGEIPDQKDLKDILSITFTHCMQNSQVHGTSNEHMASTIGFHIRKGDDIQGTTAKELSCSVRQPAGGSFEYETTPIEVDVPDELILKINYSDFRDAVETYFREIIGSNGSGIRIGSNSRNTLMSNNLIISQSHTFIRASGRNESSAW